MAEIEGGAEIQPFLDLVHGALGSFASSLPSQVRYELASQLMESSQLIAELQINTKKLKKENEGHQHKIAVQEQTIEAKDSKITVLTTKLANVGAKCDSLQTKLTNVNKDYNILLKKNNILDNRELMRRLEEKFPLFICKFVPGLVLNISFRKLMEHLNRAEGCIQETMTSRKIAHTTKFSRQQALDLIQRASLPTDFPRNLVVLLASLLDEENPLTFEVLNSLDQHRRDVKDMGDEEAHGKRPEPYENFDSSIVKIRDLVFGGSEDNALFKMIVEWAAVYKSKWPLNTPTRMQQHSGWTPNQTPTQTPTASQSSSMPASRESANTGPVGTGMNRLGLASSIPRKNATKAKAAESNMKPCALDFRLQTSSSLSPRPGPSGSGLSHGTQINQPLSSARPSPQLKKHREEVKSLPQRFLGALSTPRARGRKRHNDDSRDERNHKRHKGNNR